MTDDFMIKTENLAQSFWSCWSHRDGENDKECFHHFRLFKRRQLCPFDKDIFNAIPIAIPPYFNIAIF